MFYDFFKLKSNVNQGLKISGPALPAPLIGEGKSGPLLQ